MCAEGLPENAENAAGIPELDLPPLLLLAAPVQVVGCLGDPELPVRVDAVVAIRHFVDEVQDLTILRPVLPALLSSIFHLMSEVDNEDLVFTLETIVEKFDEEIAPFALQMTQQLSAAFWKYVNSAEEDDDDDNIGERGWRVTEGPERRMVGRLGSLCPASCRGSRHRVPMPLPVLHHVQC